MKCHKCVYYVHWLETLYICFTDKWGKNIWLRCHFTLFVYVFSSAKSINREGNSTEFQYHSALTEIFAYILFLNRIFYVWKILWNFTNDIQQYHITMLNVTLYYYIYYILLHIFIYVYMYI